jgi:hypothetical protein
MIQIQELDKLEEDGSAKLFHDTFIDESTVDKTLEIINKNNFQDESFHTATVNGFQTPNIINLFSEKLLRDIIPVDNFYKSIFHLHYINYRPGGSQNRHNHLMTEEYSFILYLNDADGDTVFESPINKNITPKKGRLIVFSSDIMHFGLQTFNNKKVLVGAINKKN